MPGMIAAVVRRLRGRSAASTSIPIPLRQGDPATRSTGAGAGGGRPPVAASVADLAQGAKAARLSRIFLAGTPAAGRDGGIALSRRLASLGTATILVDFAAGADAARRMGSFDPVEDVMTMAASPASFAHSIQRDCHSAAHTLAVDIDVPEGRGPAMREATAIVLDALAQAYACSVVIAGSLRPEDVMRLSDEDTAIVVPIAPGEDDLGMEWLEALSAGMQGEIVLMTLDAAEHHVVAA